jgi:hypothetical protein
LRPKIPLFSFIALRLFHQGKVANGPRIIALAALGMLRPVPVEASERPYMIRQPPERSRR